MISCCLNIMNHGGVQIWEKQNPGLEASENLAFVYLVIFTDSTMVHGKSPSNHQLGVCFWLFPSILYLQIQEICCFMVLKYMFGQQKEWITVLEQKSWHIMICFSCFFWKKSFDSKKTPTSPGRSPSDRGMTSQDCFLWPIVERIPMVVRRALLQGYRCGLSKWLRTMVSKSRTRVVPLPNGPNGL